MEKIKRILKRYITLGSNALKKQMLFLWSLRAVKLCVFFCFVMSVMLSFYGGIRFIEKRAYDSYKQGIAKRFLLHFDDRVRTLTHGLERVHTLNADGCSVGERNALEREVYLNPNIFYGARMALGGLAHCSVPDVALSIDYASDFVTIAEDPTLEFAFASLSGREGMGLFIVKNGRDGARLGFYSPFEALTPSIFAGLEKEDIQIIYSLGEGKDALEARLGAYIDDKNDEKLILSDFNSKIVPLSIRLTSTVRSLSQRFIYYQIVSALLLMLLSGYAYTTIHKGIHKISKSKPVSSLALRNALKTSEFQPFYQPILNLQSGHIIGCEVLVRWVRSDGTLEMPSGFLSIFEKAGLNSELTLYLIEKSFIQLKELIREQPSFKIHYNIFSNDLQAKNFLNDLKKLLKKYRIAPERLTLEVSENGSLTSSNKHASSLKALKKKGVHLSFEDIHLTSKNIEKIYKMGFQSIKINTHFFDDLMKKEDSDTHVSKLLKSIFDTYKMDVIVKNIETIEQAEYLKKYKIDKGQGHLFAAVLSAKNFDALIQAMGPRHNSQEQKNAVEPSQVKTVNENNESEAA